MRLVPGPCNYRIQAWITAAETRKWGLDAALTGKRVYLEIDGCGLRDWTVNDRMPQVVEKHSLMALAAALIPPAAARKGINGNMGLDSIIGYAPHS